MRNTKQKYVKCCIFLFTGTISGPLAEFARPVMGNTQTDDVSGTYWLPVPQPSMRMLRLLFARSYLQVN